MRHALLPALGLICSALAVRGADRPFDGLVLPFHEVVVSSPVQSTLVAINVQEGDAVTGGEKIAQLYARLEELDVGRARADLEKKEFDAKGSKNLYADKVISEEEAMKNRLELESAKLVLQMAQETFNQRSIVSPIAGTVVEKLREVGETVSPAQPIFRIVDISRVYVQFYLRAEDLPRIHLHDTVSVRCPVLTGDERYAGAVDFIDSRVDAASGLLRVKVLLPNPAAKIRAGVRAEVTLER
jgi:RND family efflux transporter MFP subunit